MEHVRYYTTPSTVPECVRPGVAKDWWRFWRRLRRRHDEAGRELEFRAGTPLKVEGVEFLIRYDRVKLMFFVRLPPRREEEAVRGHSAFGAGKPRVYLDDLQDALDKLCVQSVMEA